MNQQAWTEYLAGGGAEAFDRVVRQHVDLVYSAALRQMRDPGAAEDVTQAVFVLLARKSKSIGAGVLLSGWLYNTTRLVARNAQRMARRRSFHEQQAAIMRRESSETDNSWADISPLLDEAMATLKRSDRELVVLRFFERRSYAEISAALGIAENVASRRLSRAVEKLRTYFGKHGQTVPAVALGGLLTERAVEAAPPSVAASIAHPTAAASLIAQTSIKMLFILKLKLAACVLIGSAAFAGGLIAVAQQHADTTPPQQQTTTTPAVDVPAPTGVKLLVRTPPGQPIADAKLWLIEDYPGFPVCKFDPPLPKSTTLRTDANGNAGDPLFPPTSVNILAHAPGHASVFMRAARLDLGAVYPITLGQGQSITGTIKHADGSPAAGVKVTATPEDPAIMHMDEMKGSAVTDAEGKFSIDHLTEGTFEIVSQFTDEKSLSVIAPITTTITAESPRPLELVAMAAPVIRGRYIGLPKEKLAKAEIFVSSRSPKKGQWKFQPDEQGNFSLPIPPKSICNVTFYDVSGYVQKLRWPTAPDGVRLNHHWMDFGDLAPGSHDNVEVEFYVAAQMHGVVTDENDQPVTGVYVSTVRDDEEHHYSLYETKRRGEYKATSVRPNEPLRVKISGEGIVNSFVEDATFTVRPGETIERNIKVKRTVYPPRDQTISGQVLLPDGQPAGGAQVYLMNGLILPQEIVNDHGNKKKFPKPKWEARNWEEYAVVKADAEGRFEFDLLRAGKTDLAAYVPKQGWAWLRNIETGAKDVQLTLASQSRPFEISGALVDDAGKPVAGARVVALGDQPARRAVEAETSTDASGKFRLEIAKPWRDYWPPPTLLATAPDGRISWKYVPPMNCSDVALGLRPSTTITGRIVDPRKQPRVGADVFVYFASHPDFGQMHVWEYPPTTMPRTISGQDGRFTITGVPQGGRYYLKVKHRLSTWGDKPWVVCEQPFTDVGDIEVKDGISIEGTVRLAATGQPVAGAKVVVEDYFNRQKPVVTDDRGRYRLEGLTTDQFQMGITRLLASVGDLPELEGSFTIESHQLYSGDTGREMDIVISRSFAAEQAEWRKLKGTDQPSKSVLALFSPSSDESRGEGSPNGSFKLLDAGGKVQSEFGGLDAWGSMGEHATAFDSANRVFYVCEGTKSRLLKFELDGTLAWAKTGLAPMAVAVDPKTGNAWVLTADGTIYGKDLLVVDPEGNVVKKLKIAGHDIAYSRHDDCFWVVSQTLRKVSREGQLILAAPTKFGWMGSTVAVDSRDGTVWVSERLHEQVSGAKSRLLSFAPDGALKKEIEVPVISFLAIDEARDVVWAGSHTRHIFKVSTGGEVLAKVPVSASNLCIEPDTGCVWTFSNGKATRLDRNGAWISELPISSVSTVVAIMP